MALYRLAALTGETRYSNHADRILQLLARVVPQAPTAFGHLLAALAMRLHGLGEVAIVGDRSDLVAEVQRRFLPCGVLAWGEPYDSPLWHNRSEGLAYVCRDYACLAPASTVEELADRLSGR
jgi:uncharacterized protein YyaL (SSP411 family)